MDQDILSLKELYKKSSQSDEESSRAHHINDGFLCRSGTLILYLIKKSMETPESEWLKYEVDTHFKTNGVSILTIAELKDQLNKLIPNPQERPIIFFDECSGHMDINQILLIRTELRLIGLIPVFMGTDAEACRILSKLDSSRITPIHGLHAIVVNQLPPTNQQKLNNF